MWISLKTALFSFVLFSCSSNIEVKENEIDTLGSDLLLDEQVVNKDEVVIKEQPNDSVINSDDSACMDFIFASRNDVYKYLKLYESNIDSFYSCHEELIKMVLAGDTSSIESYLSIMNFWDGELFTYFGSDTINYSILEKNYSTLINHFSADTSGIYAEVLAASIAEDKGVLLRYKNKFIDAENEDFFSDKAKIFFLKVYNMAIDNIKENYGVDLRSEGF